MGFGAMFGIVFFAYSMLGYLLFGSQELFCDKSFIMCIISKAKKQRKPIFILG